MDWVQNGRNYESMMVAPKGARKMETKRDKGRKRDSTYFFGDVEDDTSANRLSGVYKAIVSR
jgi:hypothetical protein